MQSSNSFFRPNRIFVEEAVADLPLTRRILERLPRSEVEEIDDIHQLKTRRETKKSLLLARKEADPLKEFAAMTTSCHGFYYSLDLVSNCHYECTYCILQSYLENNPILTIFTNIEEILERLEDQMHSLPKGSVVGTGRIADSLALESLTGLNEKLIPFFGRREDCFLELKTKSDEVDQILGLDHRGKTIVSWSLSPETIIRREEYKTAPLSARLAAMKKCAEAGYKIGLHFDPVIFHDGWKTHYEDLIHEVFRYVSSDAIFWTGVGTLRFPMRQKRMMERRFPKNREIFDGLRSTDKRFLHYADALREEIYEALGNSLREHVPPNRVFTCMEDHLG